MPFPFTCPSCRKTSQVLDHLAGTQGKCPTCGEVVQIPARSSPSISAKPRPALAVAMSDIPVVSAVTDEPSVIVPITVKPASPKSRTPLIVALLLVGGGLLLFCCVSTGVGGWLLLDYRASSRPVAGGFPALPAPNTGRLPLIPTTKSGSSGKAAADSAFDDEKQPPAYWVKLLREGDAARTDKAREMLVRQGALAVPDLRNALRDRDPKLRLAAVTVLGQIGDLAGEAVGDVSTALTDSEASIRIAAAQALARMGKPGRGGLIALLRASADPHPGVRAAIAETLRSLGPPAKEDLAKLAAFLQDKDPERRLANMGALAVLKLDTDASVALFGPLLQDPDPRVKREAIRILGAAGPSARPAVFPQVYALLEDADPDVRSAALAALLQLGRPGAGDIVRLQNGLRASAVEMRRYSAESLGALGPAAGPAVSLLARAVSDRDPAVRTAAAAALVKIGKPSVDVLDDVLQAHRDSEPAVRKCVVEIIALAAPRKDVPETLFAMLADSDESVRATVYKALRALQPPAGKERILHFHTALKSPKVDLRRFAATELERLGADAAEILPTLVDAMKDSDAEVQQHVYATLGSIGPKAQLAVPTLMDDVTTSLDVAGQDAKAAAQLRRATVTLAKIGEVDRAIPLLRQALKNKNPKLRKEVLDAIVLIGPAAKETIPDICSLLNDAENRPSATQALAKMGKAAVPDLIRILEKGSREAKVGAIRALEQMKPEDAKDAIVPLYAATRAYRGTEVADAAQRAVLKLNPPKKKD